MILATFLQVYIGSSTLFDLTLNDTLSQNVDLMYIFNPEITCIITLDWHRLLFPSLLFIFLNKYTSVKNNLKQYIWQKFEDFFHTFPLYAW